MKKYQLLCLLLCSFNASAVYVNHQGLGDVLLVPYYTVNNGLNTLVSVTNPTANSKAIKINIREGLNGHAVLSYNVYLGAFDTWTFVFVPNPSSIPGFVGQDSVVHVSSDQSCAPFLNKAGQEFLPYELTDGPQDMSRLREGFIEVIEMGEFQGDFVAAADHGYTGVPANCNAFADAWQVGGVWDAESDGDPTQDLIPGTGGLLVETDIIDVAEGVNFSIPVIALDDFFAADAINHVDVGDTSLSLDAAEPLASLMANNNIYQLAFESGADAVSAVLMAEELIGTYVIDSVVAGKSETVFTQPTRRFYIENGIFNSEPPYALDANVANCSVENYGGSELDQLIVDRESQFEPDYTNPGIGVTPPRPPPASICGSVFVQSMLLPGYPLTQPEITASENYSSIMTPTQPHATENGFVRTRFLDTRPLVGTDANTNQSVHLLGLPIIGITLQKYYNAAAGPGLLAQYGGAHKVKSKMRVIEPDQGVNN